MLLNFNTYFKFFYFLKPIIPRKIQFFLRRILVASKIDCYRDIWPIDYNSGNTPEWFKGWPDNRKFAFVLTHDVERAGGLNKIGQLLEIDNKYNIKSSFGLVPERYAIPENIFDTLRKNGNEIYVHDLNHDGKLFSSYSLFKSRADKINSYMHSWGSKGFRAGAMHHNLDWIGELDISYDMSTFDTDPFEPMPDGVQTIFPFIASSNITNKFFVEIPYTLPQDLMTLVIHPDKSLNIWYEKLDWIVKHQGMVCVNVHPDYIAFKGESSKFDTYMAEQYERFLAYIDKHYRDSMWNAHPFEICQFVEKCHRAG